MRINITCTRLKNADGDIVEIFNWTRMRQTLEPQYALTQIIRYICGILSLHYSHGIKLKSCENTPFSRIYIYEYNGEIFPPSVSAEIECTQPRAHNKCTSCIFAAKENFCWLYGKRMDRKKIFKCHAWIETVGNACNGARIHIERGYLHATKKETVHNRGRPE